MLVRPRFVVIDDKDTHLSGLRDALDYLCISCHTKLYEVETVPDWQEMPGVRMVFIDKYLRTGVTMGGGAQDTFSAIAEVLEKIISDASGPYGLVLWAEAPEVEALKEFLQERLGPVKPELLPMFYAELRKSEYIDTGSGACTNPEKLRGDIVKILDSSPQMKALFAWEADVLAASDAVLRSLVNLVDVGKRTSEEFAAELGKVLFRISEAGAGIGRARENPRESVNRVLVPIVADRIIEHDPEGNADADWDSALVDPDAKLTLPTQAAVNSAVHLSTVRANTKISACDLGAVVEFPYGQDDSTLKRLFGLDRNGLFKTIFEAKDNEWDKCQLRLVNVGASCDFAQPKPRPMTYLLALEWECFKADGSKDRQTSFHKDRSKKAAGEWHSPILEFPNCEHPGKLSVFCGLALTRPRSAAKRWKPAYRLREELAGALTHEFGRHISRPGFVELK